MIPLVDDRLLRKCGEVDFYLTQFLAGHGLFRAYLHKMGKIARPGCAHCNWPLDDAHHTFFHCRKWSVEREALERALGATIMLDTIVGLMLRDSQNWARVTVFVKTVVRSKKQAEEERRLRGDKYMPAEDGGVIFSG